MTPANEIRILSDGRIFVDNMEFPQTERFCISSQADVLIELTLSAPSWADIGTQTDGGIIDYSEVPGFFYMQDPERKGAPEQMHLCAYKLLVDNYLPPCSDEEWGWHLPCIADPVPKWGRARKITGEYLLPILLSAATAVLVHLLLFP